MFLNLGFTLIEFVGGWLTNSTAIMADAVHDLGYSPSISLAWFLAGYSRKKPTHSFTYGYRRFSMLGALINGAVLIAGSIWVLSEAIPRLTEPQMPDAGGMFLLAICGVLAMFMTALHHEGRKEPTLSPVRYRLSQSM